MKKLLHLLDNKGVNTVNSRKMKNVALIADKKLHVFIAEDDIDDIDFFRSALSDISRNIKSLLQIMGRN